MTAHSYFIAVNYRSHEVIGTWARNIRRFHPDAHLIVVDSFHSDEELTLVRSITAATGVTLLEKANTGYGSALNFGLAFVREVAGDRLSEALVVAGNLDIEIEALEGMETKRPCAMMPAIWEQGRNRNPFMTRLQRKLSAPLYFPAARYRSPTLFWLAVAINRLVGLFPSAPYAVHGSLFCVSGALLQSMTNPIFDESSFLYWEEVVFADYLKRAGFPLVGSGISARHSRNLSTRHVVTDRSRFLGYWSESYLNWRATARP